MGIEDIVYDLIKEYRASRADKQKQIEIAKLIAKKTYLRFHFEWKTERDAGRHERAITAQKAILKQYAQIFLDIAVEIYDVLPDESERMQNIASIMKSGAYAIIMQGDNTTTTIGDECSAKVTEFVQELIE